jgi:hypothetical protein
MGPVIIKIATSGAGIELLKKVIINGIDFMIYFSAEMGKLEAEIKVVNKVFESLGLELRIVKNPDATISTVMASACAGALFGVIIAAIFSAPLFWPAVLGATVGAAANKYRIKSVRPVLFTDQSRGLEVLWN